MAKVVVVFHGGYGHTIKQTEAVAKGANGTLVAIDAEGNLTDAQWKYIERSGCNCIWLINVYGNGKLAI